MRKIQRAIFFLTPGILMRFLAKKCENIAKSRQKMIPAHDKATSTMMSEAEYWALVNTDLHFKLFNVPLINMDTAPRICIHLLHQSHNPLLHIKFSQVYQMTFRDTWSDAFSRSTKAKLSLLLAARYFSCSCLTTKIASVVLLSRMKPNWESSIDTNCLIICPQSSPGLSWPALSAWDCGSWPFPMRPPFPYINSAPSQRSSPMIAAARQRIMETPMSPAARIISSTMSDVPGALSAFICEIVFLIISMVIGMGRPSTGGW